MIYTIFDLETTGFNHLHDDVVQLAYVRLNSRMQKVSSGNLYFYYDRMNWSEKAYAVHQISQDFLKQYVNDFEENVRTAYAILQQGNLVGHNCDAFDIPFVDNFLSRMGAPHISALRSYDTMKIYTSSFGKRPKLSDLPGHLKFTEKQIDFCLKKYFPDAEEGTSYHDARYDVAVTAMAFTNAISKGLITIPR